MATGEINVCNKALSHLKAQPISSIDPVKDVLNHNEQVCSVWYDEVRRSFLEDHPWNFATKRAKLPRAGTPLFGFEDAYDLPDDFLRVNTIGNEIDISDHPKNYEIESGQILINQDLFATSSTDKTLPLTYVFNNDDPNTWPPLVVVAMSYDLALAMAPNIRGTNKILADLLTLADRALRRAKASDGQQRPPKVIQVSKNLIRRRFGMRGRAHLFD